MKVIYNFLLSAMCLTIVQLYFNSANAGTSLDEPTILECSDCYTDYQYKQKALSLAPANQVSYYLVYNENSQILKTIKAVNIFEPYDEWASFKVAYIQANREDHEKSFLAWILGGNIRSDSVFIDRAYPSEVPADSFSSINAVLLDRYGVFYNIRVSLGAVLTVTTSDGYTMVVVKTTRHSTIMYKVLAVYDQDGNLVPNSTDSSIANGSYFFRIGAVGYTLIMRNGTVTVTEDDGE